MRRLFFAAGAIYVGIITIGIGGEVFLRAPLLGATADETAANMALMPANLTLSLFADAVMITLDVALTVLLVALLWSVSPLLAGGIAAFRLMQAAVLGGNLLLLQGATIGASGNMHLALIRHAYGYDLGLLFFGIATLLTAIAVARWKAMPRWLSPLIGAAGLVYVAGSSLRFVAPDLHSAFAPAYLVPVLAESAFAAALIRAGWRDRGAPSARLHV